MAIEIKRKRTRLKFEVKTNVLDELEIEGGVTKKFRGNDCLPSVDDGDDFYDKTNGVSSPNESKYVWTPVSSELQHILNGNLLESPTYLHTFCIKTRRQKPLYIAQQSPFDFGFVFVVKIGAVSCPPGFGNTEKEAKMWAAVAALDQLLRENGDQQVLENEENEKERNYVNVYKVDADIENYAEYPLPDNPEIIFRSPEIVSKVENVLNHLNTDAVAMLDNYSRKNLSQVPEYVKRASLFWE